MYLKKSVHPAPDITYWRKTRLVDVAILFRIPDIIVSDVKHSISAVLFFYHRMVQPAGDEALPVKMSETNICWLLGLVLKVLITIEKSASSNWNSGFTFTTNENRLASHPINIKQGYKNSMLCKAEILLLRCQQRSLWWKWLAEITKARDIKMHQICYFLGFGIASKLARANVLYIVIQQAVGLSNVGRNLKQLLSLDQISYLV